MISIRWSFAKTSTALPRFVLSGRQMPQQNAGYPQLASSLTATMLEQENKIQVILKTGEGANFRTGILLSEPPLPRIVISLPILSRLNFVSSKAPNSPVTPKSTGEMATVIALLGERVLPCHPTRSHKQCQSSHVSTQNLKQTTNARTSSSATFETTPPPAWGKFNCPRVNHYSTLLAHLAPHNSKLEVMGVWDTPHGASSPPWVASRLTPRGPLVRPGHSTHLHSGIILFLLNISFILLFTMPFTSFALDIPSIFLD